jgi:hypothetical protein
MGWPVVALVLVTCAVLGAVAGSLRTRSHVIQVVVLTAMLAFAAFAPGICAQGIADTTTGVPIESLSCDTLYGARLPELGPFQENVAGWLLGWLGAGLTVASALVTRRSRSRSLDA